ncbi:hypothetical protein KO481_21130 [Nocardia sp. NEAU-G5]|uniref:Uncharacterized protein n=1 Tax=Nocardia albiluteola TaxID=2842303 RepID=A0ABS6B146_9NOCA|nr:hypothetical protein [Nocardia albiluteola]MBU3064023.1 hypothetical protein [Nocardia albiluteola]
MRMSIVGAMLGCAAVGTLVCATPARAAQGTLIINGHSYAHTSGCLTIRKFPLRLRIVNNSAGEAHVYLLPGCNGGVTSSVDAGAKASSIGASVLTG